MPTYPFNSMLYSSTMAQNIPFYFVISDIVTVAHATTSPHLMSGPPTPTVRACIPLLFHPL